MKRSGQGSLLDDYNAEYRAAGLCIDCHAPRGEDGTTTRCRECANAINAYGRQYAKRVRSQKRKSRTTKKERN